MKNNMIVCDNCEEVVFYKVGTLTIGPCPGCGADLDALIEGRGLIIANPESYFDEIDE